MMLDLASIPSLSDDKTNDDDDEPDMVYHNPSNENELKSILGL